AVSQNRVAGRVNPSKKCNLISEHLAQNRNLLSHHLAPSRNHISEHFASPNTNAIRYSRAPQVPSAAPDEICNSSCSLFTVRCPLVPALVFSNPGMSLKGEFEAGSFGRLLFGMISYIARGRLGGGNVGIGFIDFQGLWEGRKTALLFSGLSINRHFHGPLPLRPMVQADLLICSNMVLLACCMRRAASVSLMDAATRFSAASESPGRRNCCGRSSESSFSSGVCQIL